MMTKGRGGGKKSQKIDDVFYEQHLRLRKQVLFSKDDAKKVLRYYIQFSLNYLKFVVMISYMKTPINIPIWVHKLDFPLG